MRVVKQGRVQLRFTDKLKKHARLPENGAVASDFREERRRLPSV